jgi:hypothetical protein
MSALSRSLCYGRSALGTSAHRHTARTLCIAMTRLTHLFTALAFAGLLCGATITACGGNRTSPGEMPPLAPKPELVRPNAIPMPGAAANDPTVAKGATSQPSPVFQAADDKLLADQPTSAPADAGTSDSAPAPLPPLRDASIPADSRMEPILQKDGGR